MKTLQGIEIEGDLLKLYLYTFAPDGCAHEAGLMAQAVGLEEELRLLISLQKFAANFVLRTIDNALSDNNVLLAEKAFGLPKNLLRFSWRGSTDCMDTLRNHAQNNVYNFFGGFCSIRVNKAASAITNRTAMYIPICSEYFPEKLKKHNQYKQTAKAITNIIHGIFATLQQSEQSRRIIDASQIRIITNHPDLGIFTNDILK
jgi:hypothetical protein